MKLLFTSGNYTQNALEVDLTTFELQEMFENKLNSMFLKDLLARSWFCLIEFREELDFKHYNFLRTLILHS